MSNQIHMHPSPNPIMNDPLLPFSQASHEMKHNEISSVSTSSNSSSHTPQQFVEWSDALHYTCWCNSTIMASPQQVIQTLYPYHVQNVPTTTTTTTPSVATTTSTTISTMSPMARRNDGDYDHQLHYIPWCIDKSNTISNSEQEQQQISALLAIIRQRLATSSDITIPSAISGSKKMDDTLKNPNKNHNMNHHKSTVYSSIMSLWNQFVYNNNNSNDDDETDSTDYYNTAIMQQNLLTHPGYDIRNKMNMTNDDIDDYQNMIPKNAIMSSNPIATTTMTKGCIDDILNQMYISIDAMLDCIVYIQQQLQSRQQQFLLPTQPNPKTINHQQDNDEDDDDVVVTATATIVSVHSIRKEWFATKNTFGDTNTSSASCTNVVSTSTALPLPKETMNADPSRVAQFVAETLSDQQFHWLLSILCQTPQQSCSTTTTTTEEMDIDHQKYHDSYCLLQRIDRDVYSGGSVYVLQLPMMMMINDGTDHPSTSHEIRLTLYDLQQSKNTIRTNIEEWRNRIQEGAPPIMSTTNEGGANTIKQQRLKYLQRKRLYEQHIDNAESMLLNLESVELSILHTIHVSRPTISLLRQAKDVLQSLRGDSTNAILSDIENEIILDDELDNELELISSSLPYEALNEDDENDNDGTTSNINVVVNEDDDIADLNVRLERLMSTTDTEVSKNRVHVDHNNNNDNTSRTLEQGNALLV